MSLTLNPQLFDAQEPGNPPKFFRSGEGDQGERSEEQVIKDYKFYSPCLGSVDIWPATIVLLG